MASGAIRQVSVVFYVVQKQQSSAYLSPHTLYWSHTLVKYKVRRLFLVMADP